MVVEAETVLAIFAISVTMAWECELELTTTAPANPPLMTSGRTSIARLQARDADSQSFLAIDTVSVCSEV